MTCRQRDERAPLFEALRVWLLRRGWAIAHCSGPPACSRSACRRSSDNPDHGALVMWQWLLAIGRDSPKFAGMRQHRGRGQRRRRVQPVQATSPRHGRRARSISPDSSCCFLPSLANWTIPALHARGGAARRCPAPGRRTRAPQAALGQRRAVRGHGQRSAVAPPVRTAAVP